MLGAAVEGGIAAQAMPDSGLMARFTPLNIGCTRLQNQGIARQDFATPGDVVRWMGAMQAQDYGQAVWGIGARMPNGTLADVERAIADGDILRTWPMRGTIHFVAPEDARWRIRLSASRMIAKDARRLQQLELDHADINRCQDLLQNALAGGKRLTRAAIMQVLEAGGISAKGARGYHLLWHIAQLETICIGPMEGKEQTFVLLDDWAPHSRDLSRDESLAELARGYFRSHGPATVHDLAWWAGLTLTEVRAGLEAVKSELTSEKVEGKEYWMAADARDVTPTATSYLLPGFDEYLLGYTDRGAVLDPEHANKVCPGGNGVFYPMIVVDGQIVGTWKRAFKKQGVVITHEPFTASADSEAFEAAAGRYAAFVGQPLVLA